MGALYVLCRWYYIVVVPVTPVSLRRWENPEDMDIQEVSGCLVQFDFIVADNLKNGSFISCNCCHKFCEHWVKVKKESKPRKSLSNKLGHKLQ